MKKKYEHIELNIYTFSSDVITTSQSGAVDGDETIYPIPDGWYGQ